MNLLLASTIDVTLVIAIALAVAAVMRRRSASLRHGILAAALIMSAAVPAIESLVPQWEVPMAWGVATEPSSTLRLTSSAAPEPSDTVMQAAAPPSISWIGVLTVIWLAGAFVVAAGLLTGLVRLARLTRQCTVIASGPWFELADEMSQRYQLPRPVVLLQSPNASLLLTWGLFRPRILLPDGADDWSAERREVVLAHELAHIRRSDWALQVAAEALRAVYWFNPLVWLACRRLRHESEYACDDAVLDAGVEATEYATHLLGVARHAIGHGNAWASAPAIANPSTLERRISAMLSHERNRAPLTRRAWALAFTGAILVAVPVAAITITERAADSVVTPAPGGDVAPWAPKLEERRRLVAPVVPPAAPVAAPARPLPPVSHRSAAAAPAQLAPATVSGTMMDPSGAVLPGVELTLTDTQFGVRYSRVSDGSGWFAFTELQPGRYELNTRLPGFATVTNIMPIAAGANVQRTITLPIGSLEETIMVVCGGGPVASVAVPFVAVQGRGAAPPDRGLGKPIRVGGQIKAPSQVRKVNPVCPRAPDGDTIINLVARVGVDGYLNEVRHVPTEREPLPPAEFIESALEAVRQWGYTPTLLNNQPVEVNVRITVLYRRDVRRA